MSFVLYLFAYLAYLLIGGADIYFAITRFKQKHYFLFGMWTMCAIACVLFLTKLIFTN